MFFFSVRCGCYCGLVVLFFIFIRPQMYPPVPAAMIIQMGENPKSHMSRADTTGIHKLLRSIFADFAILNVGAAISATTAGRMPLKMRSMTVLSLKLWKNKAMANMIRNEGNTVPSAVIMLPRMPFNL